MKGSKKRIGPNKWRLVLDLERGLDGKRKQHRTHFTGTDRQAEVELRRLLTGVSDGSLVPAGRLKVAELMQRWLDSEQRSVSWTRRARGIIEKNINPVVGHWLIAKVTPTVVEEAKKAWMEMPRQDRKVGPLSPKTVFDIFATFKTAMKYARYTLRIIPENPCDFVRAPRKGRSRIRYVNADAAITLLEGLQRTPIFVPTILTLGIGKRRGEVLAIHKEDVDIDRRRIYIHQALGTNDDGSLFLKPTKTEGRHHVAIPQFALEVLRVYMDTPTWPNSPMLFPHPVSGEMWPPKAFSSMFAYYVRTLGLPPVSFQGLRHSFATLLKTSGVPMKTISSALMHATYTLTADTYMDDDDADLQDAAESLHAAMTAARKRRETVRAPA